MEPRQQAEGKALKILLKQLVALMGKDADKEVKGSEVEMEHTADPAQAEQIAEDHHKEDPAYYTKLAAMEDGDDEKENEEEFSGYRKNFMRNGSKNSHEGISTRVVVAKLGKSKGKK